MTIFSTEGELNVEWFLQKVSKWLFSAWGGQKINWLVYLKDKQKVEWFQQKESVSEKSKQKGWTVSVEGGYKIE
jgi:hypothetical protein